jgi:hypothetical protein
MVYEISHTAMTLQEYLAKSFDFGAWKTKGSFPNTVFSMVPVIGY